ncbi:hypothetical protein [Confluentibacter sediminis]|uniref:hypothetical protein n=1 Tax=Confluentibacter sediminis TaxID=2219045 RepID=UPI000DAE8830|nr:hypothetical protein [Confluentibacter sediminis]
MNDNKLWNYILIAFAIAGFLWANDEKTKRLVLEEKLQQKEDDYLHLLSGYLETKKDIPDSIKNQLIHLREEYVGINDAVANKLKVVIELIEENKSEIAIEKLALIIENILKERYIEEGNVKDKISCPTFYKLLEKAKELNWIDKYQFNFSLFIKDKRNEEAHELEARFTPNDTFIAFLCGIQIIYNLKGIKRKTA